MKVKKKSGRKQPKGRGRTQPKGRGRKQPKGRGRKQSKERGRKQPKGRGRKQPKGSGADFTKPTKFVFSSLEFHFLSKKNSYVSIGKVLRLKYANLKLESQSEQDY